MTTDRSISIAAGAAGELSATELEQVSGGMKLDGVRSSSNVVDGRGGQSTFLLWKITYGADGSISDVSLK